MITLYIDTSSSTLFLGLKDGNNKLYEIKEYLHKDLSKKTLPKIKELFDKALINPCDIDKILVVNGPGSFTGIRIGLTIAKTFAWGLNKNISTISSLEAMAVSFNTYDVDYIVPVIDARRNYVYSAIYDNNLNILLEESYISLENLQKHLNELNGSYAIICNDDINIESNKYDPNIDKIIKTFCNKININPHSIDANYLKLTEAEENLR